MPSVRVGEIDVHYEDVGSGPAVVLLHASTLDHRSWARQVEDLRNDHRVLALDLRGHGGTRDSSPRPYDAGRLADDLAGFLDTVGIERPVVCGLSLGGMVALTFAARYPDRLRGLVLAGTVSPPLLSFRERMERAIMPRVLLGLVRLVGYERLKRFIIWIQEKVHGKEAMGSFRASDLPPMTTRDFVKSVRAFATFHRVEVDLAAICVPTLVLHGDKEPPFVIQHAERLRAGIPGARVVPLAGAGHMSSFDAAEAFTRELRGAAGAAAVPKG